MANVVESPSEELIQYVLERYERGQSVDALRRAESFAPLKLWSGVKACVLAARLAANTGAPRLATRLSLRAWRTDKAHPAAQAQFGYELGAHRGPLALWLALRQWPAHREATPEEQAELLALRASAAADLRDFAASEILLKQAEALGSKDPWVLLQRAYLLQRQDRIEEALEVATAAGARHAHPMYRPGVQARAHLLQLLDRDAEAIELLKQADAILQNGPVAAQLFAVLSENGRWTEAQEALARYIELTPLLEKPLQKWVASQQARVAYHLGQRSEAARFAAGLDDSFHKSFSEKLGSAPAQPERVQLDVCFVRQHFKTCAPATMAALGQYWKMPAEHLKLAEAMCYDGTPHWEQRDWAESNGWFVREFRVTHEAALTLLSAGIPFAIATVEATSAHMQAVVGFDQTRDTLLLRDPGLPYVREVAAAEFLKRYRPFGPQGAVFLPESERCRLDGIVLPDSDQYDHYHQFCLALQKHERDRAAEILSQMEQGSPEHELVWEARLSLAAYDGNNSEQTRCLDKLLELFPDCPSRLLRRFGCMRDSSREDRVKFLEQTCALPAADPVFAIELARALQDDARTLSAAHRWHRRASRLRPMDAGVITVKADLLWQEGELECATELYRFAANLEGFREHLYKSWFVACRQTRKTTEAIAHLQDRFARFGSRSEQPALTLAWAWREMEDPEQARDVLACAAKIRPDDGQLMLRSASLLVRLGQTAEAEHLLDLAKPKVRKNDWMRIAAELAEHGFDSAVTLQRFREILQLEPLALDAHAGVARALSQLQGPAAALEYLQSSCAQFPHHYGLRRMVVEWSHHGGPVVVETAARELLRVDPADAWARRELAVALGAQNRGEEALSEATEGARIEPRNTFSFSVLGQVYRQLQRLPEAKAQFRRAVQLSVDNSHAIHCLLELAGTDVERKEELALVERELVTQVVRGDGLLAFLDLARPLMEPGKLLQNLRQAQLERPDLWHAWSALVSQFCHLGQLEEARDLAIQSTQRFAHLPRVWLDLAAVHQWRKEPELEIQAAKHAFEMNPAWPRATLALAGALERQGRMAEAREAYERALKHSSDEAQLQAFYAQLLWRLGQREDAFTAVQRALRLAPAYDWAWGLLLDWARESGNSQRGPAFCRSLIKERPGEIRIWLILARILNQPVELTERLQAVDQALRLDPHSTEAWDLKAELLTVAEKFEEAIRACEEGLAICTLDTHILKGRRAWIESRRRQLPEAVRLMRAVLEQNNNYVWGWNLLAHWLLEQGLHAEASAALEQILKLRPRDPWVHRQLALVRLKQKDTQAAQKAFADALQLAPTDAHAAQNILELQLKANDLEGAAATLKVMETHQPGARTLASRIFLQLRRQDLAAAARDFEELCHSPDPEEWPIDAATDAFAHHGHRARAVKVLKRVLKSSTCNPQVAAAAVRHLLTRKRALAAVCLFMRLKPGELQRRAAPLLIHGLAEARSKLLFRIVLWRRRQMLTADDETWGQVGYTLSRFNQMNQVPGWLADWRSRHQVQPWMMFNLCLGLRHQGRYSEATEVAHYVLEKWGHREGSADMRLFLAVEDALAGRLPEASEHLEKVVVRDNVPHDRELLALAKSLVEFQSNTAEPRPAAFRSAQKRLNECFAGTRLLHVMKDIRRTFRRAGRVFVQNGGGWRARWWFGWKLNWQWLLLPVVPVAIAIAAQPPVLVGILIWSLRRRRRS